MNWITILSYSSLHFALTTIAMGILEIRGGQNIFWPVNAILAGGLINNDSKIIKLILFISCFAVQTISYCGIFRKEFFWVPINISESLTIGLFVPLLLKWFTKTPRFNIHHVDHLLIMFMVVILSGVMNSLIGAFTLYSVLSFRDAELTIASISWFMDNVLGSLIFLPCLCSCEWHLLWMELVYSNHKTYNFWSRWFISILLISTGFMKFIDTDIRIDALRIIMSIPLLMYLASASNEGLSLLILCITTTLNAYINDYGSEEERSWSRFYVFWSIVVNISFIGIFHSRMKLMTSIERRVEMRTKEINELRQNAIKSSVQKAEFISYISHEIRNPVHAIGNMIECIASTPGIPSDVEPYIDNLRTSNCFILDLVTGILDLGKIEVNKFTVNITPTKIIPILNGFIEHSDLQCKSRGIELISQKGFRDFPQMIDTDGVKLQQILYNLISNAIKYTPPGGRIEVIFSYSSGQMQVVVKDSGVGIPTETLGRLFEPYVQAASAKSGTGLGLAICKAFAEKLDGYITAESTVGQGSKFIVSIPAQASLQIVNDKITSTSIQRSLDRGISLRVLIVDDSKVNRMILGNMLRRQGFDIYEAVNGIEAIDIYEKNKPFAYILSDLHMPEMSGIELRERISDDIPFIIVTGDDLTPTESYSVLRKPFKLDDLTAKLYPG